MAVLDNLTVTILTTVVTTLIAAVPAFWGVWRKAKADLENEFLSRFNTKKWEVYTEFLKIAPQTTVSELPDAQPSADLMAVNSLASQVVLAGSDKVVTAYRVWRETARVYGQGNQLTRIKLFNLVVEMRRDLGNKYTRLDMDDLLGALELESGS
jgi:hypothetical protein